VDHIKNFTTDLISGLNTDATLHLLAACLNQLDERVSSGEPVDLEHNGIQTEHAEVRRDADGWSVVYWASAETAIEEYGPAATEESAVAA
jgi:hypothetical protein